MTAFTDGVLKVSGFLEPIHGISNLTWCVGTTAGGEEIMRCRTELGLPQMGVLRLSDVVSEMTSLQTALEAHLAGSTNSEMMRIVIRLKLLPIRTNHPTLINHPAHPLARR